MLFRSLKKGCLAFFDSFAGLIPCVVLSIRRDLRDPRIDATKVTFQLVATRGTYRKGEVLSFSAGSVLPRAAVYLRLGQYRVRDYGVLAD